MAESQQNAAQDGELSTGMEEVKRELISDSDEYLSAREESPREEDDNLSQQQAQPPEPDQPQQVQYPVVLALEPEQNPVNQNQEEGKEEAGEEATSEQSSSTDNDNYQNELILEPGQLGCKHYLRACQLQCPDPICQGANYPCRFCHDEQMYDNMVDIKRNHRIDRHAVTQVKCSRCDLLQPKSATCVGCHKDFAVYYCAICTLYDDKFVEKGIYHCDKCGICKVGGRETSYHCDTCECCFKLPMSEDHVCVAGRLKQNCAVCLEDLNSTRQSVIFLTCNHNMHKGCLDQYIKTSLNCPFCRKSMVDPVALEEYYDEQLQAQPMPEEYKNAFVNIHCNDCSKQSEARFHFLGAKCAHCRSYNTMRDSGDIIFREQPEEEQKAEDEDEESQFQYAEESKEESGS